MPIPVRTVVITAFLFASACSAPDDPPDALAAAGIDSLNTQLVQAYRDHDARAYAALFTDTAVFEWPAFSTVRGPAALEAMATANWATLRDRDLRLNVATRRFATAHATEVGAFEQSWSDSSGVRSTEYGRYTAILARDGAGAWKMDRFFGFADSVVSDSVQR